MLAPNSDAYICPPVGYIAPAGEESAELLGL